MGAGAEEDGRVDGMSVMRIGEKKMILRCLVD